MLCILEILSVVYGIVTLVRGRFPISKTKEVRGPMAYVIGVMLLGVLPLAVVLALIMNWDELQQGGGPQPFELKASTVLPDVIAVVGLGGAAMILALVMAEPIKKKRRKPRDWDYDDDVEDDRPVRRRPAADLDDDDRPRRRSRRDEFDDDVEDRPRRKRDDLDERAR
jgi:hypothetical protein